MDTTEFLRTVLPAGGVYIIAVKDGNRFRHKGFTSVEAAAQMAMQCDARGVETYHACAAYKEIPHRTETGEYVCRKANNWKAAKAFWCDIDCGEAKAAEGKGYKTQGEGARSLCGWCKEKNLPLPMLINSGNGVHAYWCLDEELEPAQWVQTATMLKKLMETAGLIIDPSRTSDFASILRPVGTANHKDPANPKPVKLAMAQPRPITTAEFVERVTELYGDETGELPAVPAWLASAEQGDDIPVSYPEVGYDIEVCASKCAQIRIMRDTKGDVGYDHWRGVIGLIKYSTSGIEKAVEWSARRGETGHTNLDVDTRWNTWDSGPTTCEFFGKCNPEGCENCPFRGKVKTPLSLGHVVPEPKAEQVAVVMEEDTKKTEVTVEVPELPFGYEWDGKIFAMVRHVKNKDGVDEAHPFCPTRVYLVDRIRNAEGRYEFVARAHLPRGVLREFTIPGGLIGTGGAKLLEHLGNYEVLTTNAKDAGVNMTAYVKDAVGKLMRDKAVKSTHTCFGWQEKGAFLLGTRLYRPDGEVSEVLLSGYAAAQKKCFPRPEGSLEVYSKCLNEIYNHPGMEPFQYMMCSMWASPLVEFCDPTYKGIPVAVTGVASGKGKTTAGIVALYAFGNADELTVSGKLGATTKARAALLGAVQNLPVLFDEMTNLDSRALSELCYALSNGVESLRLQSSGGKVTFGVRESWRLQAALTGNSFIGARLAENGNTDAEAMRIFEIRLDRYDTPHLDPVHVASLVAEIARNAGSAGEAFIRYVTTKRLEVLAHQRAILDGPLLRDSPLTVNPKFRFYRNHIITTMMAARIMKELGVIEFDLEALEKFAMDAVARLIEDTAENNDLDGEDALRRMLGDMQGQTIYTETFPLSGPGRPNPAQEDVVVRGELVARGVRGIPAFPTPYDGKFYVSATALTQWTNTARVDKTAFLKAMKDAGYLLSSADRVTLGKGTNIVSKQQRCYTFDLTKIEG